MYRYIERDMLIIGSKMATIRSCTRTIERNQDSTSLQSMRHNLYACMNRTTGRCARFFAPGGQARGLKPSP